MSNLIPLHHFSLLFQTRIQDDPEQNQKIYRFLTNRSYDYRKHLQVYANVEYGGKITKEPINDHNNVAARRRGYRKFSTRARMFTACTIDRSRKNEKQRADSCGTRADNKRRCALREWRYTLCLMNRIRRDSRVSKGHRSVGRPSKKERRKREREKETPLGSVTRSYYTAERFLTRYPRSNYMSRLCS